LRGEGWNGSTGHLGLPVRKTGVTTAGPVSWPCAPDRRPARAACRRSPRGGLRWPAARLRAIPAKGRCAGRGPLIGGR